MAYVLSSLSGNLISAASAGFAPTNSADVSAIASAYQVVSATATQLNAGTAYVTSINETPISAARAGNAANASLANSAWYDGTGRMISALPDEATVSSIASAYAESAASSKLDESATADFYSTSNPSGFITGVDLSDYATTAYVDSSISSFVDSAYVESQVSGKQDTLSFSYDDDKISAINGSALAANNLVTSLDTGYTPFYSTGISAINGDQIYAMQANDAKQAQSAYNASNAVSANVAYSAQKDSRGRDLSALQGQISSPSGTIFVSNGTAVEGTNSALSGQNWPGYTGTFPISQIDPNPTDGVGDGIPYGPNTVVYLNMNWGNATNINIKADNSADPVTVYFDGSPTTITAACPFATSVSAYTENNVYAAVDEFGYSASSEVGTVAELAWKVDLPTYSYDGSNKISAINGSAIGGAGGIDSATCSAIASAYAESAASSKLDTTAFNSAYFYTTANESGYVDSAYVDSAVSSKADSSALSSYVPYSSLEYNPSSAISGINGSALAAGSTYSAGEGIDITDDVISVEAPVDIVAGPGIVIDNPDGNTMRVSTEADAETVLFSNQTSSTAQMSLSEAASNFEYIELYASWAYNSTQRLTAYIKIPGSTTAFNLGGVGVGSLSGTGVGYFYCVVDYSISGSTITVNKAIRALGDGSLASTTDSLKVSKIVGIHRIANN